MAGVDLSGKTAIVTGASLGIGRQTAIAMGRAGARVVVNYYSHAEEATDVVGAIRDVGSDAIAVRADVSNLESVEQMVATAVTEFGSLDVAISNAVYSDRQLYYEADIDGFRRTIEVTMWGAFHLVRAATQQMIRQGTGGAIVAVSSPLAFIPAPKCMAYSMAKAAIDQMSKTAALEAAPFGIRVNTIHPGWVDTPGERKFNSKETIHNAASFIPLGRLGTEEEIADAILFLCDSQSYMTGGSLLIDGGISLPWHWADSRDQGG
jgi:glucose 1-dehydrogenase